MPASPKKWFSAPGQNVVTYVCLISNMKPNRSEDKFAADRAQHEDDVSDLHENSSAMTLERSKALHELPESNSEAHDAVLKSNIKTDDNKTVARVTDKSVSFIDEIATSSDATNTDQLSEDEKDYDYANPRILKLTRMQWLSNSRDGSINASPSTLTRQSISSYESELDEYQICDSERCLSTILRLDKEHNLFGLSNITITGPNHSNRKIRRERNKAVFPQTAIINVCCPRGCCKHKTHSALPSSLKCGKCHKWCIDNPCSSAGCSSYTCSSACESYKASASKTAFNAAPVKCDLDECAGAGGLTMKVMKKKDSSNAVVKVEIEPQGPTELNKPVMARSCNHMPRCIPPSSFFPYVLPCYWPARPGAPCCEPTRCFHNPPCPKLTKCYKKMRSVCGKPCVDPSKPDSKCTNTSCPMQKNHGVPVRPCHHKTKKKKRHVLCQCILPMCENCFVRRPQKIVTAEVNPENVLGSFDVETCEDTILLVGSSGIPGTNKTQTNEQAQ